MRGPTDAAMATPINQLFRYEPPGAELMPPGHLS